MTIQIARKGPLGSELSRMRQRRHGDDAPAAAQQTAVTSRRGYAGNLILNVGPACRWLTFASAGQQFASVGQGVVGDLIAPQQTGQLVETGTLIQRLHLGFGGLAVGVLAHHHVLVPLSCDLG